MRLVRLSILIAALASTVCLYSQTDVMPLIQRGQADLALQALRLQIQQNPTNARPYNLLCRVQFQLENWDDAIQAAEKAVALSPQDSEYHQWLARSYGRKAETSNPFTALGLVRKVKSEFEKTVALDPDGKNLSSREDLAEFYIQAPYFMGGDKGKAKQLAVFLLDRDRPLAFFIQGRVEEKQNAKQQAEQKFQAALQASGNLAGYWVALAAFYRRTGNLDAMETSITKSLQARRSGAISLFNAASLLLNSGRNLQEAVNLLRQYLSLNDPNEDGPVFQAHYLIGVLLEKQGERKAASDEYRAALALASHYHAAQEALNRLNR